MARFVPSPGFEGRATRDPQMRAMLRNRAGKAANEAERIGKQAADSYQAEVIDTATGVRIEATTDDLIAASWVEFGSQNNPPSAPLRKGAEAAGMRTTKR